MLISFHYFNIVVAIYHAKARIACGCFRFVMYLNFNTIKKQERSPAKMGNALVLIEKSIFDYATIKSLRLIFSAEHLPVGLVDSFLCTFMLVGIKF